MRHAICDMWYVTPDTCPFVSHLVLSSVGFFLPHRLLLLLLPIPYLICFLVLSFFLFLVHLLPCSFTWSDLIFTLNKYLSYNYAIPCFSPLYDLLVMWPLLALTGPNWPPCWADSWPQGHPPPGLISQRGIFLVKLWVTSSLTFFKQMWLISLDTVPAEYHNIESVS